MDPLQVEPEKGDDPAVGQPAAVQAAFARLRGQFVAGLPQRWHEIETAIDPVVRRAALHRLAGAAGSYGLLELGQAARRAEALTEASGQAPLHDALQSLREALMAAGATLP